MKPFKGLKYRALFLKDLYGTVSCRGLLDGCVLLDPEGQQRFAAEKMIERCHDYVRLVVGILEDVTGK